MGRRPTKCSPKKVKKHSFFKVLLGDFSKHLSIPPKFAKNHIRPSLGKCCLQGSSGKCWNVELESTKNGLFFHNVGWQTFVKDQFLQVGDFLIFHYDGELNFEVTLYDQSCCEKDVEVPKRRRGRPPANQGFPAEAKAVEVVDLEAGNGKKAEKETTIDGRRSQNYIMPGKEIRIDVNHTSTGSIRFKLENSCLKLTLKRRAQLFMVQAIPKEIVTTQGLMNKKTVEIQDPTGRSWPITLRTATCNQQQNRYSYDRLDMSTGWRECCKANNIYIGDTVIFEFVKHGLIQLHIFSKGREESTSPSMVLDSPNIKDGS